MIQLLILGGSGILGTEVIRSAKLHGWNFLAPTSAELDVREKSAVEGFVKHHKPEWIVNCSAWTNVEGAEEFQEEALALNESAVKNIAEVASSNDSRLIHISTDYVFNGSKGAPYEESDSPNPINQYGRSKAAGESAILGSELSSYYIVRTSWLYGVGGKNFVKTMARKAINKETAGVVEDQFGSPTSARDFAEGIIEIVKVIPDPGVYHFSNKGNCSWFEFAQKIYRLCDSDEQLVNPIKTVELAQKAKRPLNSELNTAKWDGSGLSKLTPWQEALAALLPEILADMKMENHK
jgi:dTDP-4-dehydrorhamnose reductase